MMKKLLYIFLFLFFAIKSFPQNLIPNGDFELGPDSTSAEWQYWVDSTCAYNGAMLGPTDWSVVTPSPDRLLEDDIPCNWDNDTAQSGKAYISLGFIFPSGEAGKATLISPLQKDSTYKLSCYVSLQTVGGTHFQPVRIAFNFLNGVDSLIFPYITTTQWVYHDTVFVASTNATEIEIRDIEPVPSGANIDNVSLVKLTGASIYDYFFVKNEINIYPNPSSGFLQIDFKNNIDVNIEIYNSIGERTNYSFLNKEQKKFSIDLSRLPKGLYLIQIKTKQEVITKTILLTN